MRIVVETRIEVTSHHTDNSARTHDAGNSTHSYNNQTVLRIEAKSPTTTKYVKIPERIKIHIACISNSRVQYFYKNIDKT